MTKTQTHTHTLQWFFRFDGGTWRRVTRTYAQAKFQGAPVTQIDASRGYRAYTLATDEHLACEVVS